MEASIIGDFVKKKNVFWVSRLKMQQILGLVGSEHENDVVLGGGRPVIRFFNINGRRK